jgi:hypothetical protein
MTLCHGRRFTKPLLEESEHFRKKKKKKTCHGMFCVSGLNQPGAIVQITAGFYNVFLVVE